VHEEERPLAPVLRGNFGLAPLEPDLRVASIGDTEAKANFLAVLRLIAAEKACLSIP